MGIRLTYRKTLKHKKKAKYTLIIGKTYRKPNQGVPTLHTYRKLVKNVNNGTENKYIFPGGLKARN